MVLPASIQKLIKKFSEFPGIGPKQAARFVFFLLSADSKYRSEMSKELHALTFIQPCATCNLPSEKPLCPICSNPDRAQNQICIVEKVSDLLSIEKARAYRGTYYILGISAFVFNEKQINLRVLKKRIEGLAAKDKKEPIEIILGVNPTTEGEAMALFLEKELRALRVKITRLARGLPSGAELEYADQATLQSAVENRKET